MTITELKYSKYLPNVLREYMRIYQRKPSCIERLTLVVPAGFTVGLTKGFLASGYHGIVRGHRGRALLRYVGKGSGLTSLKYSTLVGGAQCIKCITGRNWSMTR